MPASPKLPQGLQSPKITPKHSPKVSFTIKTTNTPRSVITTDRSALNSPKAVITAAPLTPKSNSNIPPQEVFKTHRRVTSHGGVKGLNAFVTTMSSPLSSPARKDSLVPGSKLWESNISHYQSIVRKQKSREGSALLKALKPAHQNSFNENNNSLIHRPEASSPKSSFIKDNSGSFKGPGSDVGEDEVSNVRAVRPSSSSIHFHNISSLNMQRNASAEHLDAKKLLAKKLGVDKLFITQTPVKDSMKIPLQLYINSPDPHALSTTTRSPMSTKDIQNINSFSSAMGKINSSVNTSHMSPLLVRRIKTQIGNSDLMDNFSPLSTPKNRTGFPFPNMNTGNEKISRSGSRDSLKRFTKS